MFRIISSRTVVWTNTFRERLAPLELAAFFFCIMIMEASFAKGIKTKFVVHSFWNVYSVFHQSRVPAAGKQLCRYTEYFICCNPNLCFRDLLRIVRLQEDDSAHPGRGATCQSLQVLRRPLPSHFSVPSHPPFRFFDSSGAQLHQHPAISFRHLSFSYRS